MQPDKEEELVSWLAEASPSTILEKHPDLDSERRRLLEDMILVDRDLAGVNGDAPSSPDWRLPENFKPERKRLSAIWVGLPIAAALVIGFLAPWQEPEPQVPPIRDVVETTQNPFEIVKQTNDVLFQAYLDGQVDLNLRDDEGHSPLMIAAIENRSDRVADLNRAGFDLNAVNLKGQSALMLAASWGNLETVKLLLERGADPCKKDERGQTAQDLARSMGFEEVVTLFSDRCIEE